MENNYSKIVVIALIIVLPVMALIIFRAYGSAKETPKLDDMHRVMISDIRNEESFLNEMILHHGDTISTINNILENKNLPDDVRNFVLQVQDKTTKEKSAMEAFKSKYYNDGTTMPISDHMMRMTYDETDAKSLVTDFLDDLKQQNAHELDLLELSKGYHLHDDVTKFVEDIKSNLIKEMKVAVELEAKFAAN